MAIDRVRYEATPAHSGAISTASLRISFSKVLWKSVMDEPKRFRMYRRRSIRLPYQHCKRNAHQLVRRCDHDYIAMSASLKLGNSGAELVLVATHVRPLSYV